MLLVPSDPARVASSTVVVRTHVPCPTCRGGAELVQTLVLAGSISERCTYDIDCLTCR